MIDDVEHLKRVIRHMDGVRNAAMIIIDKLLDDGDIDLSCRVISEVNKHDISKLLSSKEWRYLRDGADINEKFKDALSHHRYANKHHPEYYKDCNMMSHENIIEMVCDWYARSCEKGTDFNKWIDEEVPKRFEFDTHHLYLIHKYAGMLITEPFRWIKI